MQDTLGHRLSSRRLAHASATHPWRAIGIWAAIFLVAIALIFTLLESALTTEFGFTNNPDSKRGDTLLEERLRGPRAITEIILVRSETLTVDDAAFRTKVEEVFGRIEDLGPEVTSGGASFYLTGDPSLVSEDRHTTIMPFTMTGEFTDAEGNVEGMFDVVAELDGAGGFDIFIVGEASAAFESNELSVQDISQGESIGVPAAFIILLVLFGAVVAALLPLFLAVVAIVIATGAVALVGN